MANLNEINKEIMLEHQNLLKARLPGYPMNPTPHEQKEISRRALIIASNNIRKKYLKQLSGFTNRNVILYYSGFMRIRENIMDLSVDDNDINGFMSAIYKLDKSKGLDLILHTPGGSISATEAIVKYLKSIFGNNIRTIVPQIALSAGTMLACAGKQILMGKHSFLGPTDPQFRGLPAHAIIEEFDTAMTNVLENEKKILVWREILNKYHPSFIGECYKAIELSNELVAEWLSEGMFRNKKNKLAFSKDLVKNHLNNHNSSKTHDRHFDLGKCKSFGLKIVEIEKEPQLQEAILSLHHATLASLERTGTLKIIESQDNEPWLILIN